MNNRNSALYGLFPAHEAVATKGEVIAWDGLAPRLADLMQMQCTLPPIFLDRPRLRGFHSQKM